MRNEMSNFLYSHKKEFSYNDNVKEGDLVADLDIIDIPMPIIEKVVYGVGMDYESLIPEIEGIIKRKYLEDDTAIEYRALERLVVLVLWDFLDEIVGRDF